MRDNLNIAVCYDNEAELEQVNAIVQQFICRKQPLHITVHSFANGDDLFLFTKKHGAFDLVILDVIMPDLNGLELAAKLRADNDNCKVIFLTSSPEFAVDSYKVKAYYYLLKNSASAELPGLLGRAFNDIAEENAVSVVIKEKGKWTRVPLNSIQYVESLNHTVHFHLRSGTISSLAKLSEFIDTLLSDKRFVKCHKSYIVNMQHVASITGKDFIMEDSASVPISRNVYSEIKNEYLDYFFTKMK